MWEQGTELQWRFPVQTWRTWRWKWVPRQQTCWLPGCTAMKTALTWHMGHTLHAPSDAQVASTRPPWSSVFTIIGKRKRNTTRFHNAIPVHFRVWMWLFNHLYQLAWTSGTWILSNIILGIPTEARLNEIFKLVSLWYVDYLCKVGGPHPVAWKP